MRPHFLLILTRFFCFLCVDWPVTNSRTPQPRMVEPWPAERRVGSCYPRPLPGSCVPFDPCQGFALQGLNFRLYVLSPTLFQFVIRRPGCSKRLVFLLVVPRLMCLIMSFIFVFPACFTLVFSSSNFVALQRCSHQRRSRRSAMRRTGKPFPTASLS